VSAADCGDLGAEAVDGVAEGIAVRDDVGVGVGRDEVEGEYLLGKGGEDLVGCLIQCFSAASFRQTSDAVPDLSDP